MANTSKGYSAKIGLDISDCDKKINSLNRELATIDKSMKTNSDSTELLSQKYTVMGEKAQALAEKLKMLEGSRGDVMDAFNSGKISDEDLRAYEREVENTRGELKGLLPTIGDLDKAFEVLGEGLRKVTELTAAFVRESIQVGKAFESSMSQVAATMAIEKTSDEFQRLSDKAKEMGASTRYTASEAADALNYLALAGYNADAAITGLNSVMQLAQAGGMELARASDMVTDTLSALHLYIKDDMDTTQQNMEELVNKMAKTAQKSNTSVSQLGDALLTVGGTAANMAGGLTEINTMLGVLADNGIKASEGGTHLRNILLKMSKPTKNMKALMETLNIEFYDLQGNLRPLPDIFLEMKQKMDDMGMTQAEKDSLINKAFNPTDIAAVNALLGTTADRFADLSAEIAAADGSAEKMSETMNQNLDGALRSLNSAKEAVEVEFYEKMSEPAKELVDVAANALRGISDEIKNAEFGEEFTEALHKISEAAKDSLPKVMELFVRFTEQVVPKLGDVAVKIVDITTDEVLPKLIDLFEWVIDHGDEIENGIKIVVAAMATGKVMDFTNSVFDLVSKFGNLSTAAGNAAGAVGNAATQMSTQTAALSGSAGLIAKMNLYVLALEAVVAAALLAKDAIEKQTEAMKEQKRLENGFSEYGNDKLDEYADLVSGKTKKSSEELKADLDKNTAELARMKDQLSILRKLEEEAEKTGNWDTYTKYYQMIGFDQEELDRNIEILENTLTAERKILNEQLAAEKEYQENQSMLDAQNDYSAKKREQYIEGQARDQERRERERLHAIGEATEAEKQAFAELLEAQEEEWDEQYLWDKENHEEYWAERKQFLEENKIKSKEWWESWNEVEAHYSKPDSDTEEEVKSNLKSAEQILEDELKSFRTDLDYAVANGSKTEYEANEELGRWLNENLDHKTDLYKKEYKNYLDKKQSLDDSYIKKQEEQYNDNVKNQKEALEKEFKELEIQAKNEGWSDQKLLDMKYQVLNKHKADGELYLENEQEIDRELREKQADIRAAERKAQEEQDKKDAEEYKKAVEDYQTERKKIMESAQKEAESIIQKYYTNNRDSIIKAAQSNRTVTDAKGKERLVLTDYSKKLQELKVYQKNLQKLDSMGLSNEHLKDIFSMDLDTRMKYISELVQMSGSRRSQYLSDYNRYQAAAGSVANTELKYQAEDIKKEVSDKYDELVKDASMSGTAAAKAYVDAWNKYIKGTPLEGMELLSPRITGAAESENIKKMFFDGMQTLSGNIRDVYDRIGNIGIVINIDNVKQVEKALKNYNRRQMNNGAKV